MKRTLAAVAAVMALAAPLSAQAHRAWLAPTSTVLSGNDAWVGFDGGMSNGVFIPDHAAMRLDGLIITAPDGSTVQAENRNQARYRSSFDLHLTQNGTYRVANVMNGVMASYMLNGEQKRWRGTATDFPGALPAGATNVEATRTSNRIETFVTLNAPTDTVFTNSGEGLTLVPVTHPNDLVKGEPATFKLSKDGAAASGVEVTVARGGTRYRDNPEEQTVTTGADGSFTVTWPEAGMYWMNASVRTPAQGDTIAANASYVAVVEVLPLTDRPSRAAPPPVVIGGGDPSELAERADNRVLIPTDAPPPSRPPGDHVWSLGGETMGTTWSARVIAPNGSNEAAFAAAVQEELDRVVALFSPWDISSEISRFNAAPKGTWALSDEFWALLTASLDLADDTNGAVDPTLGALVDLWGFGPPGPRTPDQPVPTDEEIEAALTMSGWNRMRLHRPGQAGVQPGGLKLDFSGIAKGHAVDRVSDRLSRLGATSHLIEIGGELRGEGVKPGAEPWWVDLETPPGFDGPRTLVALYGLSVATSGDYRRYFGHDGRLYSHTLDGRTGRPIENGLASVTVLDASAMRADAMATALGVMGLTEGAELAEAMKLAVRFIAHDGQGGFVETLTSAFEAMMDAD